MRIAPSAISAVRFADLLEFAFSVQIVGHIRMKFVSKPSIGPLDLIRTGVICDA